MENTDEKTTEQNTESVNVVTENVSTEENQTELDKAKALEDKTDEELVSAQETLSNALAALPEAAGGLLASARSALEADLNLIQEEIKSRADQAVDTVQEAVNNAGSDVDSFWSKYGSKINEGAKWAVLAAVVYRLFIF
jgi:F0F1-type ATP synthase membrane subunit b/b'